MPPRSIEAPHDIVSTVVAVKPTRVRDCIIISLVQTAASPDLISGAEFVANPQRLAPFGAVALEVVDLPSIGARARIEIVVVVHAAIEADVQPIERLVIPNIRGDLVIEIGRI